MTTYLFQKVIIQHHELFYTVLLSGTEIVKSKLGWIATVHLFLVSVFHLPKGSFLFLHLILDYLLPFHKIPVSLQLWKYSLNWQSIPTSLIITVACPISSCDF